MNISSREKNHEIGYFWLFRTLVKWVLWRHDREPPLTVIMATGEPSSRSSLMIFGRNDSTSFLLVFKILFIYCCSRASLIAQSVQSLPAVQETRVRFLGGEGPVEKEMATHVSILAWRVPWTEEPCRQRSMGSQESDTAERLSARTHGCAGSSLLGLFSGCGGRGCSGYSAGLLTVLVSLAAGRRLRSCAVGA